MAIKAARLRTNAILATVGARLESTLVGKPKTVGRVNLVQVLRSGLVSVKNFDEKGF